MPSESRRIAFCITGLAAGGAELALVQIVTRLDRNRWEPRVFSLSEPAELVAPLAAAGIPVSILGAHSPWQWSIVNRLTRELRAFQPEVLQTFMFHANMAGRYAAWRATVPIVVAGIRVVEADARWRMRLDRWTGRLVDHAVCVSRAVADQYASLGVDAAKLSVIPNGVDVDKFANATSADLAPLGIPHESQTLLAVGRLHPQKGFDLLLRAAEPILTAHADVHLLIVGEGPQRQELLKQISASSAASRIHLIGRRDDVASLMRASDLFVLSSRWEGMPNVVLEAMAAGLPVVATDVEGVGELIVDGESGVIVPPASAAALTNGIQALLRDPATAQDLAGNAQARMGEFFTWTRAAESYTNLWERLLAERASAPASES